MQNWICQKCPFKDPSLTNFVLHVQLEHGSFVYTCPDCSKEYVGQKKYFNHRVCMYNDNQCKKCQIAFDSKTLHDCSVFRSQFKCQENSCSKEENFDSLKDLVSHYVDWHQFKDPWDILQQVSKSHVFVHQFSAKPKKSFLIDPESFNDFQTFLKTQQKDKERKAAPKKTPISSSQIKVEEKPVKEPPQEPCPNLELKEPEVELLLCQYKDNKRFIQSVKFEDLVLKSLRLIQQFANKEPIFEIKRYGRPNKNPQFYSQDFHESFSIEIYENRKSDPEFDILIEKLWNVKNYSKINHHLIEHKKHSNYMLNKRLKLKCDFCPEKSFKFFDAFIKHYRSCLKQRLERGVPNRCPICSVNFINYFAWEQHLKLEHFIL